MSRVRIENMRSETLETREREEKIGPEMKPVMERFRDWYRER